MNKWMLRGVLLFFLCIIGSMETVHAAPSAFECLNNPELEGCASLDSQNEAPAEQPDNESQPSLIWTSLKLVFALVLILGLIYGLLKFFNQKNKLFNRNRTMENLGGMNVAQNRSIQAVRIGEQIFILGIGDDVQLITEVTDESTKESLLKRETVTEPLKPSWLSKKTQTKEGNSSEPSTVQFQQLFEKQLLEMKEKARKMRGRQGDEDRE